MRPAVDGDAGNVARRLETGAAQHALQLAPNFAFDGGVVGGQHVGTADAVLFLAWASGAVGIAHHVQHDRFIRRLRAAITADRHWRVERGGGVIAVGRMDGLDAQLRPRLPVAQQHVGILHRHLRRIQQRRLLRLRQAGHDERYDVVETGQDHIGRRHRDPPSILHIDHARRLFRAAGHRPQMFGADHHAVQPDAHRALRIVERGIIGRRQHHALLIELAWKHARH